MEKCPSFNKRQHMYKNHTPPWKDTYRKRCQDRLKKSREKFVDRFRCTASHAEQDPNSLVADLMLEEWKILRSEQQGLPALEDEKQSTQEETFDDYLAIFEEIRTELLREEQQILAEYEAGILHEEASLFSSVQGLMEDQVICPVCQTNPLLQNKAVIFCHCGVRIETEQDCISLVHVRQNLEEGIRLHTESCSNIPQFGVVNQLTMCNLLMTCSSCDFMHIIV